jgi:hypothetical protein
LALSLNADELTRKPAGYGFGSYCYRDGCIHFTTFVPNAVHRPGLLPNFYYAGANRAWHLSKLLTPGFNLVEPAFAPEGRLILARHSSAGWAS